MDLVNDLVELNSQVFGKDTGFLASEDDVQVFSFEDRAMGIVVTARRYSKASVEIFAELWCEGIRSLDSGNAAQTQFFDQAVL